MYPHYFKFVVNAQQFPQLEHIDLSGKPSEPPPTPPLGNLVCTIPGTFQYLLNEFPRLMGIVFDVRPGNNFLGDRILENGSKLRYIMNAVARFCY